MGFFFIFPPRLEETVLCKSELLRALCNILHHLIQTEYLILTNSWSHIPLLP